jgi:Arc/MetJ family transcription regulator
MCERHSGPLAIYAKQLGCRAAAVDYGPYAKAFLETVADRGVDYRECDLTCEPLLDKQFEFECRVIDDDLESLRHSLRHGRGAISIADSRDFLLRSQWHVDGAKVHCVECYTVRYTMPTNLAINDRLLEEAQKVGRHRTKRETVNAALEEYIKRRKQQEIVSLFGKIEYERGYDYKRERKAKRI